MTNQLSETAEAEIRAGILTGTYAFGERLSDRVLAERLGISRTPVRLALSKLAESGLVVVKPKSGTTVMNPDAATVRDCCAVRALLETGALRLALEAGRADGLAACSAIVREMHVALAAADFARFDALDTAFHEGIVAAAGNPFLVRSYRAISDMVAAIRHRLPRDPARYAAALDQHERILSNAEAGRLGDAQAELTQHVTRVAAMLNSGRTVPQGPARS